jgi:hypothetical protein
MTNQSVIRAGDHRAPARSESGVNRRSVLVNSVVSVASLASSVAIADPVDSPSIAPVPAVESKEAIIARAEELVDVLSTSHVREGWSLDKDRATQFLENVRQLDIAAGDTDHERKIIEWVRDHGQSLDWLLCGDPGVMVCKAAARSMISNVVDPIFAKVEAHKRAWINLDPCSDLECAASHRGDKAAERELARLQAALDDATEKLLDPPTTIAGFAAVLAYAADYVSGNSGAQWPTAKPGSAGTVLNGR